MDVPDRHWGRFGFLWFDQRVCDYRHVAAAAHARAAKTTEAWPLLSTLSVTPYLLQLLSFPSHLCFSLTLLSLCEEQSYVQY